MDAREETFQDPTAEFTIELSLTAEQQVWIAPNGMSGLEGLYGGETASWFSGHLIYAL